MAVNGHFCAPREPDFPTTAVRRELFWANTDARRGARGLQGRDRSVPLRGRRMATAKFSGFVRQIGPSAPDGELLARFVGARDEAAFADLVARYGPMVFAACRRVTRDRHLADDAFQAVFVVLAAKAGAV